MRGNNVMKGYYADPEATERAFAGGWFHSGDVAVRHPDGYVEIVDRAKDVIISGGENISTQQVEKALLEHDAVLECAVVAIPDEKWGEVPKAFVTLKPGRAPTRTSCGCSCARGSRRSRCRRRSSSASCRRRRPARSRSTCCANGSGRGARSASTERARDRRVFPGDQPAGAEASVASTAFAARSALISAPATVPASLAGDRRLAGEEQHAVDRFGERGARTAAADRDVAVRAARIRIVLPIVRVRRFELAVRIGVVAEEHAQIVERERDAARRIAPAQRVGARSAGPGGQQRRAQRHQRPERRKRRAGAVEERRRRRSARRRRAPRTACETAARA